MYSKITSFAVFLAAVNALPQGSAPCTAPPPLNQPSIDLITSFEGFRDSPYTDPTGNPTVGYGHLCPDASCSDTGYAYPMSEEQGRELLQKDLVEYELCLANALGIPLNDNQYGALTSWTFNEGCGNMQTSTLISRLNAGEDPNTVAAEELPQWDQGGGETIPGLQRRRAAEVQLFQTASSVPAIPC